MLLVAEGGFFMHQTNKRIAELFDRWYNNKSTAAEKAELIHLLKTASAEKDLYPLLEEAWNKEEATTAYGSDREEALLKHILTRYPVVHQDPPVSRLRYLRHWWAAAAVLVLLGSGIYFWQQQSNHPAVAPSFTQLSHDILPGKTGAILTLASGEQVILDSLKDGVVAAQHGTQTLLANGQLSYSQLSPTADTISYNTLTTPKGRQFKVMLPDSTMVWLNSSSSLTYPTVFAGRERKVTVSGEAYFEVAQNKNLPFRVHLNESVKIEVLGTHFNVNAYTDEASIKTTLLEGKVRVIAGSTHSQAVILPGQQAQIIPAGNTHTVPQINITKVDTEQVMAWKNGWFNFENASLEEVMRQLARWYDIEVVYENGIPDIHFVGEMNRNISLAGLLKILEKTGVHFRLENGRRLVVLH